MDPSSYSHPETFKTSHVKINWLVDFEKQSLEGFAVLTMKTLKDSPKELIFDTQEINIHKVQVNGKGVEFYMGKRDEHFGTPLCMPLPDGMKKDEEFSLHIEYETSNRASALQWMEAKQTMGKEHPFMYSQCQSIFVRSILPCQDSPSDKFTYEAEVRVKSPLVVLMSAVESKEPSSEGGITTFHYKQEIPIPSYLIAIVAGSLQSRDIGPRSKVWAEKEMVDDAAWEFEKTEEMIVAAEKLAGPYVWKRYDLLVLPPTFPFGGMENPCLTFVTPALVAGDRSLTHVVAHEISHSWTGNLVTNRTWEDFWLNEGYTRFLERKIVGTMYGEKEQQFHALGGLKDLQDSVNTIGATSPLTHLVPDLTGIHPDDAFSRIPYEKGFTLLYYLEQLLGGREVFEPFLRNYIDEFKYKSLTTAQWRQYLYGYFSEKHEILDTVDWDAWFHGPGMPPVIPHYDESLMLASQQLAKRWLESKDGSEFNGEEVNELTTKQKFEFIGELLQAFGDDDDDDVQEPSMSAGLFARCDELYGFSAYKNVEIRCRMLQLGLRARSQSIIQPAIDFATTQGREKYVRPMYRLLSGWELSKKRAVDAFLENQPFMHPITAGNVKKDLGLA